MAWRLFGWITAAIAGAVSAVVSATLIDRMTAGGEGYGELPLGLHFGVSAFAISGWLALSGMFILFLLWEGLGRAPSIVGYALAAPIVVAAGLTAFFAIAYDYPPAFSFGAEETYLLATVAASGLVFALVRKIARKSF